MVQRNDRVWLTDQRIHGIVDDVPRWPFRGYTVSGIDGVVYTHVPPEAIRPARPVLVTPEDIAAHFGGDAA